MEKQVIKFDNPHVCAAVKLGALILGVATAIAVLILVPYGASAVLSFGISVALYCLISEKKEIDKFLVVSVILTLALAPLCSAIFYFHLFGSPIPERSPTELVGIPVANFLSLLPPLIFFTASMFIYYTILSEELRRASRS